MHLEVLLLENYQFFSFGYYVVDVFVYVYLLDAELFYVVLGYLELLGLGYRDVGLEDQEF